jgi:hypothetical protein
VGGGVGGAGSTGSLRSRAESDNVPHTATPAAVVLDSSVGQMSEKRQFLSNFLRSRPPASQIPALNESGGSQSPSLASPKRKGLTRVDGGPIAPLAHSGSEASMAGSGLATQSTTAASVSSTNSAHKSPGSSPSPPPLTMHRVDRSDPDLSPRSGSPAPDAAANKGGVSITRLTGFQRNPEAVRAMLAAAGVDPESVARNKARPTAPAQASSPAGGAAPKAPICGACAA